MTYNNIVICGICNTFTLLQTKIMTLVIMVKEVSQRDSRRLSEHQ